MMAKLKALTILVMLEHIMMEYLQNGLKRNPYLINLGAPTGKRSLLTRLSNPLVHFPSSRGALESSILKKILLEDQSKVPPLLLRAITKVMMMMFKWKTSSKKKRKFKLLFQNLVNWKATKS